MREIRPTTIKEIEKILDRSYFTKESFLIKNEPMNNPFLVIQFIPKLQYTFSISNYSGDDEYEYVTYEAPGMHMASAEEFVRRKFPVVMMAIGDWVERIREDFHSKRAERDEYERLLDNLRADILKSSEVEGDFSENEIQELREKLDALHAIVEGQATRLEISESQIKEFEREIANIKDDLEVFPKGVWHKVAGNKLLKAMGSFFRSKEARQLLVEGVKKLLE